MEGGSDLREEDLKAALEIVGATGEARDLRDFRDRLFEGLGAYMSHPVGIFGLRRRHRVQLFPTDLDGSELKARYPTVHTEQAEFLSSPPERPTAIAGRAVPEHMLHDLVTTQVYWPRYDIREAVALFFTTRTGYHGGLSVCLDDPRPGRVERLRAFLEALGPHVANTVANLVRLDDLAIREATLEEVTRAGQGAVLLVGPSLEVTWMSDGARALLREGADGGEAIPRPVVSRCARIWAALEAGGEALLDGREVQFVVRNGRRLVCRYDVVRGDHGRRVLVLIEDPEHERREIFERRARAHELTPRQEQVAWSVCQGLRNREIGERLAIATQTVKNHLKAIFEKVGARSRTEVARILTRG